MKKLDELYNLELNTLYAPKKSLYVIECCKTYFGNSNVYELILILLPIKQFFSLENCMQLHVSTMLRIFGTQMTIVIQKLACFESINKLFHNEYFMLTWICRWNKSSLVHIEMCIHKFWKMIRNFQRKFRY